MKRSWRRPVFVVSHMTELFRNAERCLEDERLTMMILAAGAMEWTHCKSKEASADHEAEMGVAGSSLGID
jgi:hypothetical protein